MAKAKVAIRGCGADLFVLCSERMNKDAIIARLRAAETDLRARGVAHAALFGSRARGDFRPDSDTDILIDIEPSADISVYDYVGLKRYIASLLEGPVDVVDREGLKPYVRPPAESEAVYAF
jgi:predicted nucleotidyltransferase